MGYLIVSISFCVIGIIMWKTNNSLIQFAGVIIFIIGMSLGLKRKKENGKGDGLKRQG